MMDSSAFDLKGFTRPSAALLTYYLLIAVCTLPGVCIVLPALWIRYATLRYSFDEEGVSILISGIALPEAVWRLTVEIPSQR